MIKGIHHITAIASSAQETVNFYTKILGLRLVKKSVNQDDTAAYHLFFGDKLGHPGMDLTFFIFLPSMAGVRGNGLVTTISLAVPLDALPFWLDRFKQYNVRNQGVSTRFGQKRIVFFDGDDQQLELVGVEQDVFVDTDVWATDAITKEHAIRHFYSATLSVVSRSSIEPVLVDVFGYTFLRSEEHIHLFQTTGSQRAHILEVSEKPSEEMGVNAAGTVHHIAFRADDEKMQAAMRDKAIQLGLYPTEVIDRYYFKSVYFRTPAGILFEIATDGPGFTADETVKTLGGKLALPPFLEPKRAQIEAQLLPLSVSTV